MAANVKANLEALGCDVSYMHGETSTKTRLIDIRSKQHIVRIDNDVQSKPIDFTNISESNPKRRQLPIHRSLHSLNGSKAYRNSNRSLFGEEINT
jgi:hypothetical protein